MAIECSHRETLIDRDRGGMASNAGFKPLPTNAAPGPASKTSNNGFKPLPQQAPPSWLAEDDDVDVSESNKRDPIQVGKVAGGGGGHSIAEREEDNMRTAKTVWYVLKFLTLTFCVLIFATAIIRLETITLAESPQVFVCSYMIFFSTLLFTFEAMQSQPIMWLDHMLRRNFGFLYNPIGKALFDIFIGFLCLGLSGDLSLAVGIAFACFGGGQIALYMKNPTLFRYNSAPEEGQQQQQQQQQSVSSMA